MQITRNEFDGWKQGTVTREVFKMLEERKNIIAHELASGGALLSGQREVSVGRYLEINDLLKTSYDDMKPPKIEKEE